MGPDLVVRIGVAQGVTELARDHIPQANGAVPASAGQDLAVGTEGQTVNQMHMACEQVQEFVGLGFIKPYSQIGPHRQMHAVRRKLNGPNLTPTQTGFGPVRQMGGQGFRSHTG